MRPFDIRAARYLACPDVPGLPEKYKTDLQNLFRVWQKTKPRNVMRSRYYYGHEVVKNLGIAVPDDFADIDSIVGWPKKAVDALADMSRLDSFIGSKAAMDVLDTVADANDFYTKYDMLVPSELTHSVAAMTITAGTDGIARINPHSAVTAVMLWDYMRNRVKCGLTVAEMDDNGKALAYNLYEDDAVIFIYEQENGKWTYQVYPHAMGRPLIEPLIYNASLDRPFGQSRITREVMSITDSAMRTALRSEIGAEFFTSPQKVLLGTDAPNDWDELDKPEPPEDTSEDDEFGDFDEFESQTIDVIPQAQTGWEYLIGHVITVPQNEDGSIPNMVNVTASSMEPHIAYMRSLASRFAGVTAVPLNELGIVQDNPSSAEAIDAARAPLIREANKLNVGNGRALRNIGRMAVAITLNKPLSALTPEERDIGTHFMDPDRPSMVSRADAMVKLASASPWLTNTRVYWEKVGLTDDQIEIVLSEAKRQQGKQSLSDLLGVVRNGTGNA